MNLIRIIIFNLSYMLLVGKAFSICDCSLTIPIELRLERLDYGVGYTKYETEFNGVSEDDVLFEQLFKLHVAKFNNISGSIIKFKKASKHVYRSAILAENIALLSELVKTRNVKSIVVLTNSKIFDIKPWIEKERLIFATLGGINFIHILDLDSHLNINNKLEVQNTYITITSIIKIIANTDGNVLIHCLGGEHKTEMVFEVMQKCLNKINMDNIIKRYKCHTGWENKTNKGGFRKKNLDFIQNFPCVLINDL